MSHKKAIKQILIKVFAVGNQSHNRLFVSAPNGQYFTQAGIDQALKDVADKIELERPSEEYELKRLGGNQFNFVWIRPEAEA